VVLNRPVTRMLTVAAALLWLGHGCSGPIPPARIVCGYCEEADRFVRLQPYPVPHSSSQPARFDHPLRLSPDEWTMILRNVQVQSLGAPLPLVVDKRPVTPAFTTDEVTYLGETLSKAFAQAEPREWVVFGLRSRGEAEAVDVTSGGWYVREGSLHLVLANYRSAVTLPGIQERLERDPLLSNAGAYFAFVAGPHQTVVQDSGTILTLGGSAAGELAIAYKPLLLGEPVPERGAQPGFPPAQAPAQPGPSPSSLSVEERLQALKRLRDQGVLTEEEFRTKKKQLLDQF